MVERPDWITPLHDAGELTPDAVNAILDAHGGRGRRAIEGAAEGRVKRYNDFTVVVGHRAEYIVEGSQCTCPDTRYNLSQDSDRYCWHYLAVAIADALGVVDEYDLWYGEQAELL